MGFTNSNEIARTVLHRMGLRKNNNGRAFKDEQQADEGEEDEDSELSNY